MTDTLTPPQAFRKTAGIHRAGLAANRPAAADVLIGTLYFSSDTGTLERSNGQSWDLFASTGGGGGGSINVSAGDRLLGRDVGPGPVEELQLGTYITITNGIVDVAGAGQTPFIVQNLTTARSTRGAGYLPNAQELSALASGYMKSAAGTGVVTTSPAIPLADLPAHHATHEPGGTDPIANAAWTNQANVFYGNQEFQNAAGDIVPRFSLVETTGTPDQRRWLWFVHQGQLSVGPLNDAQSGGLPSFEFHRNGDLITPGNVFEKTAPSAGGRTVPMGHWQTADVSAYTTVAGLTGPIRWSLVGQTMTLLIAASGVIASGLTVIPITLPGGFASALVFVGAGLMCNTTVKTWHPGVHSLPGGPVLNLYDELVATWPAGQVYLSVSITVAVA